MVVCDFAFGSRSISDLQKDFKQDLCKMYFEDQDNLHMHVLGETFIHEYTHYPHLTRPYLEHGTEDIRYNIFYVQHLMANDFGSVAKENADR